MKWIGLTGSIGAGKSTVAKLLRKAGYNVVDADAIAHECLKQGTPTYDLIINKFGPTILDVSGDIDRRALGRVVFANPSEKIWIEGVIHPHVQARVRELRTQMEQKGEPMAFYEVPLLFEKGLQSQFDQVIVVWISEEVQLDRLQKRNAWTVEEIDQRNKAQWPIAEKIKQADYAINNDGSLSDLEKQVEDVIKSLRR